MGGCSVPGVAERRKAEPALLPAVQLSPAGTFRWSLEDHQVRNARTDRSCIAAYDSPYCSDFFSTDTARSAFQSFLVIYAGLHSPFCSGRCRAPESGASFDCTVLVFSTLRRYRVPPFRHFFSTI